MSENKPGTTVYVHWYGKLLQGTVVNNHDLMGMVAVRIPLMGNHPVALYTPAHVYSSPEEPKPAAAVSAASPAEKSPDHSQLFPAPSTKDNPSYVWQTLQKFLDEHWDHERNHLRVDALEEFYQLFHSAVAARNGLTSVSVDPGSPDGDRTGQYIVDTETGEILPCADVSQQPQPFIENIEQIVHHSTVSEERYHELKEKMKVKLTKKQLRSSGRIQYTDCVQTSIFD